jgi:putative ABC transport system permease protein
VNGLLHDFRYALRALGKSPGFTAAAVLTLALGIGANTAIFSVVNAVLLKPLPYPEPDRVVRVFEETPGGLSTASPPNFTDWQRETSVFQAIGAYVGTAGALTGNGDARRVPGSVVTPGFFPTLGTAPLLGRTIVESDAKPGQDRVVVLSHGLWQRRFGGDPGIVGRSVRLDGRDFAVIGVMPEGFQYPAGADFWMPLGFSEDELATQRGAHYLDVVARLAPGVTVEAAAARMAAVAKLLEARYPDTNTGASASVVGLHEALVGKVRPALLILLGAVGFVLLIACANVANLVLARTAGRRRELAVRSALGAERSRLVRHVLTESVLLGLLGGAAGLLLAAFGTRLLLVLATEYVPRIEHASLDGAVLAFTAGIALLTSLLFGVLPAAWVGRGGNLMRALKTGGGARNGDRSGGRLRASLVVAQMTLAVLLLAGAGLLLKSFMQLQAVDPGFNPHGVLTFELALPRAHYPEPQDARDFVSELRERVGGLPGVESVAAVFGLPLSHFNYTISVEELDGRPAYDDPGEVRSLQVRVVTPDYFRTMQIPVVAGRALDASDRAGTQPVVVLNEAAARLLWPDGEALGRTLEVGTSMGVSGSRLGGTVVGVAADVRDASLADAARPTVYGAHAQFPVDFMSVVVRSSVPPRSLVAPIRAEVRQIDDELPLDDVRTMDQRLADSVAEPRFYMLLLAVFAVAALFLAAIGIYGVLAIAVRQRTGEIGVRRALGAQAGDVLRMVIGRALALAGGGLVLGLLAAFALTRLLAGLLYGVTPTDPSTFAGVAALLAAVALLASFLPARRAAAVDPVQALREE